MKLADRWASERLTMRPHDNSPLRELWFVRIAPLVKPH